MGLEPTASCVTGRHSKPTELHPRESGRNDNVLLRKNLSPNKIINGDFPHNRKKKTEDKMTVMEAIRERRSVRGYQKKAVEKEKLDLILEAARLAPSASNRQEWRYVIATNEETRKKLYEAASSQPFVAEAPVVIACCADTNYHVMKCRQQCYPIDVAISIDHITLAAGELGLGTCWVGSFDEDAVRDILGIPREIRVVELLTLGYPSDQPKAKKRLPAEQIAHYERWGNGANG
jgi:nitroreductase